MGQRLLGDANLHNRLDFGLRAIRKEYQLRSGINAQFRIIKDQAQVLFALYRDRASESEM